MVNYWSFSRTKVATGNWLYEMCVKSVNQYKVN